MDNILFLIPMHITMDSFVNPSENDRLYPKSDGKYYNSLKTDLPLGPLSISAYTKKFLNVNVKLIDFNVELSHARAFPYSTFFDYCHDFLSSLDFQPDIVGVSSLFSPSYENFMDCGRASKEIWRHALVLGGGNIPTNDYRDIYGTSSGRVSFDALCYGEGEKPFKDLLLSHDRTQYLNQSNSWVTAEKLQANTPVIPQHDFIEDLDEIPFFDYDLCDIVRHNIDQVATSYHNVEDQFGFHIMTSRGCPFLCTFCASHKTHGRTMRYHSVGRVKEDLNKLKEQYGAKIVVFQDDHLMGDKDRVYRILEVVKELGLGSFYQNGLTLYSLDRPMLEAFYAAGVRHLVLPVESGSEKVLKHQMKKPLRLHISERVARDCRDLGIYTKTNILIGMPGETKEDIEETRHNLRKIKTNWFSIACASPLVGSEMHDVAKENGYINISSGGGGKGSDFHFAVITTEDFTPEYIQKMQYILNLELNFIYNNDMEIGDWATALIGFKNCIHVRSDHAFAHYYAALCYQNLGDDKNCEIHKKEFTVCANTPFWKAHIKDFHLNVDALNFKTEPPVQEACPTETRLAMIHT